MGNKSHQLFNDKFFMTNSKIGFSIFMLLLSFFSALQVNASNLNSCSFVFGADSSGLLQVVEQLNIDDTTTGVVRLSLTDLNQLVWHWTPTQRPEFEILVLRSKYNKAIIALVPKRSGSSTDDLVNKLFDQQVVQWEVLPMNVDQIQGINSQSSDGIVSLRYKTNDILGQDATKEFKTKIRAVPKLEIQKIAYKDLLAYVQQHPRIEDQPGKSSVPDVLRDLFGRVWIKIIGSKGELNSFEASKKLLQEERTIVPGKQKIMHVVGQIFVAEFNVDEGSSFSGSLASGKYYALGRLSSGLKNLDIRDENGEFQTNSIGVGILLFRTLDQAEQPGILFFQDSLVPVANPGLTKFQLTNNPHFEFQPTSVREVFEQGASVLGVAFAAFMNERDSGRGVQGNYRSAYGVASNAVNLSEGQAVRTPRFLALRYEGGLDLKAKTHPESMSANAAAGFTLRTSDDGKQWAQIGSFSNIKWLGVDSHELTFPHGLSGTIDPVTLRASTMSAVANGLTLPIQITSENKVVP